VSEQLSESAIDFAAVTDGMDGDQRGDGIQLIHDSVIPDPKPVEPFGALEFHGVMRQGIAGELRNAFVNLGEERLGECGEILLDGRLKSETIRGHASAAAWSFPQS